jgi:pimeloyl-ACP methyl ester carboxylesterase
LLAAVLLCAPLLAQAETVLFIHGHLGGAQNWRSTGIAARVVDAGWHDAGTLGVRRGRITHVGTVSRAAQRFFTLQLDGQTALQGQSAALARYVEWVRERYPRTPLILIGHSAGGLVARLYMVQHPGANVAALITIATPHLGTPLAQVGELVEGSPLAWLAPLIGARELSGSLGLYRDLAVEQPGNFLYSLNRRPHPPARYISVVRTDSSTSPGGDLLVPEWSQDLRSVQALRGRARTLRNAGTHALSANDGDVVIRLLQWLQQA